MRNVIMNKQTKNQIEKARKGASKMSSIDNPKKISLKDTNESKKQSKIPK